MNWKIFTLFSWIITIFTLLISLGGVLNLSTTLHKITRPFSPTSPTETSASPVGLLVASGSSHHLPKRTSGAEHTTDVLESESHCNSFPKLIDVEDSHHSISPRQHSYIQPIMDELFSEEGLAPALSPTLIGTSLSNTQQLNGEILQEKQYYVPRSVLTTIPKKEDTLTFDSIMPLADANTTNTEQSQANPTERANQTIGTLIAIYSGNDHRSWDEHLPQLALAMRTCTSDTTKETPAYLNFGRDIRLIQDLVWNIPEIHNMSDETVEENNASQHSYISQFQENLKHAFHVVKENVQAFEKSKQYYNANRLEKEFNINELVLRRTHPRSKAYLNWMAKLAPKWEGPFVITKKHSALVYEIEDSQGRKSRCNIVDLKAYNKNLLADQPTDQDHDSTSPALTSNISHSSNPDEDEDPSTSAIPWSTPPPDLHISQQEVPCAAPNCCSPDHDSLQWIQCDGPCDKWYHLAGVTTLPENQEGEFFCELCHQHTSEEATTEYINYPDQRREGLRPLHILKPPSRFLDK